MDALQIAGLLFFGAAVGAAGVFFCCRKKTYCVAPQENQTALLIRADKLATLGKHAASIIHDVNNPLMLMREHAGWIRDLLEEESPQTMRHYAEIEKSAEKIELHVDRARDITRGILDFARERPPTTECFLVHPIAKQAISFFAREAKRRGIDLFCHADAQKISVLGDKGQLEQVLVNILDNAMAATPKQGRVELTISATDRHVLITVQDSGTGIPETVLPKLFESFFTTKAASGGTGLGLAICASIIQKQDGTLTAANAPEGGAVFTLSLPLASSL